MSAPSVLLPATRKLLEEVRPAMPFFPHMMAVEAFEAKHSRGRLKLLPHNGGAGGFFVFDSDAPFGRGTLSKPMPLEEADKALQKLAARR